MPMAGAGPLLEAALTRENLRVAWRRVKANKGAAGVDGLDIEQTHRLLQTTWPRIRQELLAGKYRPQPVRRVTIPKPGGSQRELGIPTVTDRLIQQALLQVLQPLIDPTFSDHSHGFRPGRNAHDAVKAARAYVQSGKRVVVDVDLAKFFDRVNHDILMGRLGKRIADTAVLRLIRAYLDAGIMDGGVKVEREQGTPQGGPLSPLLANVLLDEVDKALEARGYCFARYADDCNVYVGSKRAGDAEGRVHDGGVAQDPESRALGDLAAGVHRRCTTDRGGGHGDGAQRGGTARQDLVRSSGGRPHFPTPIGPRMGLPAGPGQEAGQGLIDWKLAVHGRGSQCARRVGWKIDALSGLAR